jgi:hypothetical protein
MKYYDTLLEILTILVCFLFIGLVIMKYADRTWLPLTPSPQNIQLERQDGRLAPCQGHKV